MAVGGIIGAFFSVAVGGIDTLHIDVNANNYDLIVKLLKKAIIENGRGYDAKDDRMTNNPNQMNIQSMYSDIDLDIFIMTIQIIILANKLKIHLINL